MRTLEIKPIHEKFIDDILNGKIIDLESFIAQYIECKNEVFIGNTNHRNLINFINGMSVKIVKDCDKAIELASDFNTLIAYLKEYGLIIFKKELHKSYPPEAIRICEMKQFTELQIKNQIRPIPFEKFYDIFPKELFNCAIADNGLKAFKKHGYKTREQYEDEYKLKLQKRRIQIAILIPIIGALVALFSDYIFPNKTKKPEPIKSDTLKTQSSNIDTTAIDSLISKRNKK